jgi:hypothetical protein
MITLILKNYQPIAYAVNEVEAKQMIMNKLETHPEWYSSVEEWWEVTGWNVKQIYSFKTITNKI